MQGNNLFLCLGVRQAIRHGAKGNHSRPPPKLA